MVAPAATAASEHPVPAHAVAECAGELLGAGDGPPCALWVVVGRPFAGALGEVCSALGRLLSAPSVVGMAAAGVVLGGRVCRDGPALGVLATWEAGVRAHWLAPGGRPAQLAADPGATVLVVADPFSVRPGDLAPGPGPTIAGGFLAGGAAPGTNRIVVDGAEHADGAVAWVCPPGTAEALVSHGTAPLAGPMVVTATLDSVVTATLDSEVTATLGSVVTALDGLPAAEAFEAAVARAPEPQVAAAVELGLRVPASGELLAVRRVPEGLEVRGDLRPGDVVEPAVRSAASCAAELAGLLGRRGAGPGHAALAFLDLSRPAVAGDAAALADVVGAADTGLLAGGVVSGASAPPVVRGAATVALLGGPRS